MLAEKPRTLPELCEAMGITSRPAEAVLSVNASLGLVSLEDDLYSLTLLAEDYSVESSPTSFTCATQRWPDLQAIVLDLASVCEVAEEIIERRDLRLPDWQQEPDPIG